MTSRSDLLKMRKDQILAITIEEYINSIAPVSSSYITQRYFPDLSSATVRNILAELEEEGYLTHPHTSAGRVPTQHGYRYYVDHLMDEIRLLEEERVRIKASYERESLQLESLLEKTSRMMSETTHYTSIISVDGWDHKVFYQGMSFIVGYPDHQDVENIRRILMALEEKERILKFINRELKHRVDIFIGQEIACSDINTCSLVVSRYATRDGTSGRIAVLGPTRMDYERVVSAVEYYSELMAQL